MQGAGQGGRADQGRVGGRGGGPNPKRPKHSGKGGGGLWGEGKQVK